jgi:DNA-binding MarR family transcriptional regulator
MTDTDRKTTMLTDVQICGKLYCAGFAIAKLREMELAKFGLTTEQSTILHILSSYGRPVTVNEIIDETMRQPNSVYILLNKMAKIGLIEKSKGSKSENALVSLTEQGQDLLEKITDISVDEIFSILREADKVALRDILNGLLTQSRYLLGIGYMAPINKLLNNEKPEKLEPKISRRPTATQLWPILNNTKFAVSRLRELELAKFGLTMEQSSILHIILDHGGTVTIKEIIDETMHQPNSVYILLNKLKKMKLIRDAKQKERGITPVSLTEDGKSMLKKITNISFNATISRLKAAEKAKLVEILLILIDKSGELLGIPFTPPIMQRLAEADNTPATEK